MKRIAALTTCLALLIPGASIASASCNATCSSYGQAPVKKVDAASASRTPSSNTPSTVKNASATRTTSTGSLPFTGLDLGALGAGAVVLLGAGMVLRRASATDRR